MEASTYHTPVLLQEAISYLLTTRNGIYVDGTLGGGGHAETILQALDISGKLVGIDLDDDAIAVTSKRLAGYGNRTIILKENFKNIKIVLSQFGITAIRGVLLDLGVSSFQLDEPTRGFSFRSQEPLDMRMDRQQQLNAKSIVNQYDERTLASILWKFGEERHSRRIAKAILRRREQHPIESTDQLAAIIEQTIGRKFLNKTLARVFQAIRITVNDEIENLRQALHHFIDVVEPGGRIVVISYHSLEDRIVKETFRRSSVQAISSENKMIPVMRVKPTLKVLTRKPIIATEEETRENPRARSGRLRAAEKL